VRALFVEEPQLGWISSGRDQHGLFVTVIVH